MENFKPKLKQIKPVDTTEEGQRILANVIASAYLHTKKERQAESQPDCKTKDKEVKNNESIS